MAWGLWAYSGTRLQRELLWPPWNRLTLVTVGHPFSIFASFSPSSNIQCWKSFFWGGGGAKNVNINPAARQHEDADMCPLVSARAMCHCSKMCHYTTARWPQETCSLVNYWMQNAGWFCFSLLIRTPINLY